MWGNSSQITSQTAVFIFCSLWILNDKTAPNISSCFPKLDSTTVVFVRAADREGYRQRKKERGGGVWPTFHSSLCTVGQAVHAERLESLCNTPPTPTPPTPHPIPPSWFFKIKDANAYPPALHLSSLWRGWTHILLSALLCSLCSFCLSLKSHVEKSCVTG